MVDSDSEEVMVVVGWEVVEAAVIVVAIIEIPRKYNS